MGCGRFVVQKVGWEGDHDCGPPYGDLARG